jgi:hypothetical protein
MDVMAFSVVWIACSLCCGCRSGWDDWVLRGGAGLSMLSNAIAGDGLVVGNATCRLSGCTLIAGDGFGGISTLVNAGYGLSAYGSAVVTVAGTAADVIEGGSWNAANVIGGNGIVCMPPAAVVVHGAVIGGSDGIVTAAPTMGSSITLDLLPLPRLRFAGSMLGNGALQAAQPITLSLDDAPPSQLFVLLVDLNPGATALPGLSIEPLLVSGTAAIASFGLLDASGAYTLTAVPITQLSYVVGLETHWQAFAWDPALARWHGSNAALLRVEL